MASVSIEINEEAQGRIYKMNQQEMNDYDC